MCAVGVVIILWYMGNLLLFLCVYLFQVERELSTPGENIKTFCFCVHVSGRAWAYNTWWGWNLRLHVTVAITSAAEAVHHLHADAADRPLPVAGQRPVPGRDGSLDAHWSADLASADSDWPLGSDWISVCILHLETVLCWWLDLVRVVDSMRGFVTSDWLWRQGLWDSAVDIDFTDIFGVPVLIVQASFVNALGLRFLCKFLKHAPRLIIQWNLLRCTPLRRNSAQVKSLCLSCILWWTRIWLLHMLLRRTK